MRKLFNFEDWQRSAEIMNLSSTPFEISTLCNPSSKTDSALGARDKTGPETMGVGVKDLTD